MGTKQKQFAKDYFSLANTGQFEPLTQLIWYLKKKEHHLLITCLLAHIHAYKELGGIQFKYLHF